MNAQHTHEARPRVEGDRELEILEAALDVLADVGYDRLTMDAVATRAKASKATLYRRWNTKAALVIDALTSQKDSGSMPDTGSLRDDLIAMSCGFQGFTDSRTIGVLAAVITALNRDADFAKQFRKEFVEPKLKLSRSVYERAHARGEIRDDLDIDLLAPSLAGIVLHRIFLLGQSPSDEEITQIIDQIIIPACRPR